MMSFERRLHSEDRFNNTENWHWKWQQKQAAQRVIGKRF